MENRLRTVRHQWDLQQKDVAKLLGIARDRLSLWECGKFLPPWGRVLQLSGFYVTPPVDLFPVLGVIPLIDIEALTHRKDVSTKDLQHYLTQARTKRLLLQALEVPQALVKDEA